MLDLTIGMMLIEEHPRSVGLSAVDANRRLPNASEAKDSELVLSHQNNAG